MKSRERKTHQTAFDLIRVKSITNSKQKQEAASLNLKSLFESLSRRRELQANRTIQTAGGFGSYKNEFLLLKVFSRAEKNYSNCRASTFGLLKEQNMLRDMTLVYYVGINKMHNLATKKLMGAFYAIKCEERF